MASDDQIVTWNVTNWITIILMASIGFGILSVIQKFIAAKKTS